MYLLLFFCNMNTRVSAQHGTPVQIPSQAFRLQKPFAAQRRGAMLVSVKVLERCSQRCSFAKVFGRKGVRKSNSFKTVEKYIYIKNRRNIIGLNIMFK